MMQTFLKNYFGLIKNLLPQGKEDSSVGLDIGINECRLVELTKSQGNYEVTKWMVEPIRGGDFASSVRNMTGQLEKPLTNVYTSVFGKGTLIRYIEMPRMSLKDLKKSFALEADKHFPFPADQIYTDCNILDNQAQGKTQSKQMPVIAVAVRKELIDQRMKLLSDLGLDSDFIGVNSVVIANLLRIFWCGGQKIEGEVSALLEISECTSSISIFIDQLPFFTRDIYFGTQDFLGRISNTMGVSLQDAERLRREPMDKHKEIMDACESVLMNIIQELRLSFDYFSTEKGKEVSKLFLIGDGCLLNGIVEFFAEGLDVKTVKWDPFESLRISSSANPEELKKNSLKLAVGLGLALYHYA